MRVEIDVKKAVGDFSLDMRLRTDSNVIGILGPSGSGKSMLLKCMAGLMRPDVGKISIDDNVVFDSLNKTNIIPQKRGIAYMFQSAALFNHMTVLDNIKFVEKPTSSASAFLQNASDNSPKEGIVIETGKTPESMSIDEIINLCRIDKLLNLKPQALSGGERQRVAMARVLACRPSVILLDEPFSALDVTLRGEIENDFRRVIEHFSGVVFLVSHDFGELYRVSKDIAVVEGGRIVEHGTREKIADRPQKVATLRLLGYENIFKTEKLTNLGYNTHISSRREYTAIRAEHIVVGIRGDFSGKVTSCTSDIQRFMLEIDVDGLGIVKARSVKTYNNGEEVKLHLNKVGIIHV